MGGVDDTANDIDGDDESKWPVELQYEDPSLLPESQWEWKFGPKQTTDVIDTVPSELIPTVPDVPDPFPLESDETADLREKMFAKSRYHCLTHTPFNKYCEGCAAKARNKSHYRGAFLRKEHKKDIITMDQLTVAEIDQPLGIGGYKYAIIFQRVDNNYWWFIPLRTLKFEESYFHFNLFCLSTGADKKTTTVYCDQHQTLSHV